MWIPLYLIQKDRIHFLWIIKRLAETNICALSDYLDKIQTLRFLCQTDAEKNLHLSFVYLESCSTLLTGLPKKS